MMDEYFREKAKAATNLLRQDIALRLSEAINAAARYYRRLKFGGGDLAKARAEFFESFFALYIETKHLVYNTAEKNDKKELLDIIDSLFDLKKIKKENEKHKKYKNLSVLRVFDEYLRLLKDSGILDIRYFDIIPEQAWRESI